MLFSVICALGIPLALAVSPLRIHHRIYHPHDDPQVAFSHRGTILLSSDGATFAPSESLADDLAIFAQNIKTLDGSLYQVALERDWDSDDGQWDISSVKACHLPKMSSESLILHLNNKGSPFALDYFVSPIPHGGSCPKRKKSRPSTFVFPSSFNSTVSIRSPKLPPSPELRVPPPLSPEGAPIQPMPEKTFIQKYWLYITAGLIALALAGSGPEEEVPRRANQ